MFVEFLQEGEPRGLGRCRLQPIALQRYDNSHYKGKKSAQNFQNPYQSFIICADYVMRLLNFIPNFAAEKENAPKAPFLSPLLLGERNRQRKEKRPAPTGAME
jgi:hypothetical protein